MGNKGSKKSSKKFGENKPNPGKDVQHKPKAKYVHSCKSECFDINPKHLHDALSAILKQYDAEYLTALIIEFLPTIFEIIKLDPTKTLTTESYHCYSYPPIDTNIKHKKICKVWLQSMFPMSKFPENESWTNPPTFKACI